MKPSLIAWTAVGLLSLAGPALAHHSAAMFDRDKELKLEGTIKAFSWTNPHSWIEINVTNASGEVETWGVECNSPNNLARTGWKSTTLKPGDKVTISVHPLRTGEHGGGFMKVAFPDGHVLGDTPRAAPSAPASGASEAKSPY